MANGKKLGWGEVAQVLVGVGWRLALPMVLLTILGVWLDRQWGTKPWLSLAGLVLGMAIGYYSVYRLLLPIMKGQDKGKEDK